MESAIAFKFDEHAQPSSEGLSKPWNISVQSMEVEDDDERELCVNAIKPYRDLVEVHT